MRTLPRQVCDRSLINTESGVFAVNRSIAQQRRRAAIGCYLIRVLRRCRLIEYLSQVHILGQTSVKCKA